MKDFFRKKYVFGTLFLGFILIFPAVNLFFGREAWKELGEDVKEIENVDMLRECVSKAEETAKSEMLGEMGFIETYGGIQRLLGKREFNNFSFIRGDDGMLYYGAVAESKNDDLEEYAGNIRRMKEVVEQNGAKLIVVIPPSKIIAGISNVDLEWPINNPNARTDKFMKLMMENDIFAVDMRPAMQKSGEKLEDLFFKTDHHWTPLAAFYAAKELEEQVERKYGDSWDPEDYYTNLKNYHTRLYEDRMLGSSGRNTGVAYAGMEDYLLLWPECDMQFTWTSYEEEKEQTGDFREALFDMSVLEETDIYSSSFNSIYLDEIVRHDKIVNHSNPEGPSLTVLRDSYFSPMACFLAPMCSEIEMVWSRATRNDIDFEKYVRESEADYVLLEVYPYNINEDSFDFFKEE